jgi:hypothetical protein
LACRANAASAGIVPERHIILCSRAAAANAVEPAALQIISRVINPTADSASSST